MLFVFDENFSKNLAAGLHLLEKSNPASAIPVDIMSAEELLGKRGAHDLEIIKATGKNGVVFTRDKDFKQIKLYGRVIEATGGKVLFFKPSKKLTFFWDTLAAIIARWDEIKEKLSQPVPPHVYEFDIRTGIKECHL